MWHIITNFCTYMRNNEYCKQFNGDDKECNYLKTDRFIGGLINNFDEQNERRRRLFTLLI